VKRIVIWHDKGSVYLRGVQLFDRDGNKLLETLNAFSSYTRHEVILEDNERIIGFKSKQYASNCEAWHCNLQFVIGKME
jgi:hypothetical protein